MGYIKFNNSKKVYEATVRRESDNVVKITFKNGTVKNTEAFIYSDREDFSRILGKYNDFKTVYRENETTLWLSNDGSTYSEPEKEREDPYIPTIEELKPVKKEEIGAACEQMIYYGIDVALPGGAEHFSLTEKDQINLFGKQAQIAAGAEKLEYHQDGHPCKYYSKEEMEKIIEAAMFHVSYHTTYCNALNMWIAAANNREELAEIFYGADVPEKHISVVLADYIDVIAKQGDLGQ